MYKWGIAGTGRIAHAMAKTLTAMDDASIAAVSSNDSDRAARFAGEYRIAAAVTDQAAIAECDVDAVYVANTNEKHMEVTLACLDAGIPVLCEKPLAIAADDAGAMIERARTNNVFLMEAMWMVFQPAFLQLRKLLVDGVIGTPTHVTADFGFPAEPSAGSRLFDPAQGGGGLLDLGIYPLTFAIEVLGAPAAVAAVGVPTATGVDAQMGAAIRHVGGGISTISSSVLADTSVAAVVSGPEGRIMVNSPFHHSQLLTLHRGGDVVESWDVSYEGSGYRFEVAEVHRCIAAGEIESPMRPLDDTLEVMHWLDVIGAQIS
ncbi:MAG: Gfo/Idh/MocA family oxidoreductase [Acidimicrobiia bacterium]|nr:Gfo/Idh/MocA family oxidoreductase [Acidimicrobiia bacterium]